MRLKREQLITIRGGGTGSMRHREQEPELCCCGGKCEGICRTLHKTKMVTEKAPRGGVDKLVPRTCGALYIEKKREPKPKKRDREREVREARDY